jgi:hypothetical protein
MEEYYLKYSGRCDCIYTDSLQHIQNSYHPAGDLENIRKDKEGQFALIFKDVHRFGDTEVDGTVLLSGKNLTQGHVVHDILPELHDIVQFSGGTQLFGSVDAQRTQRVLQSKISCAVEEVCDGVCVHHGNFAKNVLKFDADTLLQTLIQKYPAAPNQDVSAFQVQLVKGTHPALNSRCSVKGGKPMLRHKFFFQTGDPEKHGILRYGYTSRQNRISLLTADVAQCPEVAAILNKYNRWVASKGFPSANYVIITLYNDGQDNIPEHSDKTVDFDENSLLTVVKLGPGERSFVIRDGMQGKTLFNETLSVGSAVTMTVKGNNATSHEVPKDSSTLLSGSIVFRTIKTRLDLQKVCRAVKTSDKTITTPVNFIYKGKSLNMETAATQEPAVPMQVDGDIEPDKTLMIAGAPFTVGIMALPDEFSAENYVTTYNKLKKISYKFPSRSSPMFLFGGTIGPTDNAYKQDGIIMPRPNAFSRPGSKGYAAMNEPYVAALAASAEEKMLAYLETHDPDTLKKVLWFKANVPAELRVSGTIFNAMALVGDLDNGKNHIHTDDNDICSLIIMLGANISGGRTFYYDGPNEKAPGNIVHSEPFEHGKFQVGPFETKVHAGESWKGRRGIISFYVNKQMFEHFQKYGRSLYDQWAPRQDWYTACKKRKTEAKSTE